MKTLIRPGLLLVSSLLFISWAVRSSASTTLTTIPRASQYVFRLIGSRTFSGSSSKQTYGRPQRTKVPARLKRAASPVVGNYPNTTMQLSANTTVTPDAAPTGASYVNVATSTDFKGKLEGTR